MYLIGDILTFITNIVLICYANTVTLDWLFFLNYGSMEVGQAGKPLPFIWLDLEFFNFFLYSYSFVITWWGNELTPKSQWVSYVFSLIMTYMQCQLVTGAGWGFEFTVTQGLWLAEAPLSYILIHEIDKTGFRCPSSFQCFALVKTCVILVARTNHVVPPNCKKTQKYKRGHEITGKLTDSTLCVPDIYLLSERN